MPLVKRCVEPVFLSRSTVPGNVADELQCVTNSTLANIIRQLSSLSDHADDLFGEILKDTQTFSTRTNQLASRIQRLKKSVTQLDSAVEEVLLQEVNTRKQFKSTVQKDAQLFTIESRPKSICDMYAKCDAPPELRKLNQFRDDNYDCLNYYTNPNYFFELWSREVMNKTEQQKKEINKRRKNKRPKHRAPHHIKEAKSKRDEIQRYKHGKELGPDAKKQDVVVAAAAAPSHPPVQYDAPPRLVQQQPPQQQPPPPPPQVFESQTLNLDLLPPPPPPIEHVQQKTNVFQKPEEPVSHITPIIHNVSRTPSMMQVTRPNCAPPPAPIKQLPPHPKLPPAPSPPPVKNNIPVVSAPAPPPLPPPCDDLTSMRDSLSNANGAPDAPPTNKMAANTLLSQINNVKLNPSDNASIASSESSTTAKVDSRSDLLVAIVSGIKLRKVEERREKDRSQKQISKVLDVQQIMENAFEMRRKAMEADQDDTDEGDNDDDDWSDND